MTPFAFQLPAALLLAFTLLASTPAPSAQAPAASATKKVEDNKPHPIPFRGKLLAVDRSARTLTVGKRVFLVVSDTKIFKPGQVPGTLEDGQINGDVTGSYYKREDGRLVARSVYFGGKDSTRKPAAAARPEKTQE